jgi:hypothetical protein
VVKKVHYTMQPEAAEITAGRDRRTALPALSMKIALAKDRLQFIFRLIKAHTLFEVIFLCTSALFSALHLWPVCLPAFL